MADTIFNGTLLFMEAVVLAVIVAYLIRFLIPYLKENNGNQIESL